MRTTSASLYVLASVALLAAACGDGGSHPDAGTTPDAGASPDAGTEPDGGVVSTGVRVVHASPDAPAIDVYVTGSTTPVVEDLEYGEATTFLEQPVGTTTFEVRPANAAPTSAVVLTTPDVTVTDGSHTTLILAGLLASTDAAERLRALVFEDGFTTPGTNEARVRLVNASPDAPELSFDLDADGSSETTLARFAASDPEGLSFAAGSEQQLQLSANGTPIARFTVGGATQSGTTMYAIATGLLAEKPSDPQGLVFLPVFDSGARPLLQQNPSTQLLHAIGDAPAVDVFLGPQRVATDLARAELSAPIFLPAAGASTLDLFASGTGGTRPSGTPVASVSTGDLALATRTLLVLAGTLDATDAADVQAIAATEAFATAATGARVRFIHAAPELGAVNFGRVVADVVTPLFTNVAYGTATPAAGDVLAAGATELGVSVFPSIIPVARYALTISSGADLFAVAVPAASGTVPNLVVVDATTFPWPTTVTVASALTP